MKRCPITYEIIDSDADYSVRGLRLLSPQLKQLKPLEFTASEQRMQALALAGKMSIQGVQIKLSAQLRVKEGHFELVDKQGHYILKPQSEYYPELPENEAITMVLAKTIDLEVPVHGLVYSKDRSMTYFIKRFDRFGHNKKLPVEDFAQLLGLDRDTKYQSSMEKLITVISTFCTFPKIELAKLFKLTLFNFLTGNEDMHLKNFSLISRDQLVTLSPVYDLLNSTITQRYPKEEFALPLHGKKNNLSKNDLINYFAFERLKLNTTVVSDIIEEICEAIPHWKILINNSFLSATMKEKYLALLEERQKRLGWG